MGKDIVITLNGKKIAVKQNSTIADNIKGFDVFVRNGYNVNTNTLLNDGDVLIATKYGEVPSENLLNEMLVSRNGEKVTNAVKNACIAVCGLGGLGSNIAQMLVRLGVGKLILIDFDRVEPTNLNRQNYFIGDIGKFKTQATAEILSKINPYIKLECYNEFLNESNILSLTSSADIVVEAFDNAESKAMLTSCILSSTKKYVVASSGMAGYSSSNNIKTKKPFSRLFVVGDGESEAQEGQSLMSPRVTICAGHQANAVLRILLGEIDV